MSSPGAAFTVGESLVGGPDLLGFVEAFDFESLMPRDLRPSVDVVAEAFGADSVVTPLGGSATAAVAIRIPPLSGAVATETDRAVVDTHPRFAFRRDEVAALPQGSTFTIADGPDAGTYKVDRVDAGVHDEMLTAVVRMV